MPHCTKCGTAVADNATFCPSCGAPQGAAGSGPAASTPVGAGTSGMSENVAGLLCYVLGWVTGLIFSMMTEAIPWPGDTKIMGVRKNQNVVITGNALEISR